MVHTLLIFYRRRIMITWILGNAVRSDYECIYMCSPCLELLEFRVYNYGIATLIKNSKARKCHLQQHLFL